MEMRQPLINNGLDLDRERAEQTGDEWIFGALSQSGIVSIPLAVRELYLPIGEVQGGKQDFADCATRSPTNHLEALFTFHYQHNMRQENKVWLEMNGYVHDNRIVFSDRFNAILSGTTRQGNSLKAPIDSMRKNGMIPKKMLPKGEWMMWEDYHKKSDITQAMLDLGIEFTKRFPIHYDQVNRLHFSEALKDDMLGVAGHAWEPPVNGVYLKNDGEFNHAFLLYGLPEYQAFDNYMEAPNDFTKNLAPDYKMFDYAYRVYLADEHVPSGESSGWEWLRDFLKNLLATVPPPQIPLPPPPVIIPPTTTMPKYKWDTPANSRHSIRVIGDEMGLKWAEKDLICAVIQAESGFKNSAKLENKRANGTVWSTDWGICQINDYYHVGVGKKFPSVKYMLDNPDKCVKWMIQMYKQGKLSMWVAYKSGAYKKYMPKLSGSGEDSLQIKETTPMDPQIISSIVIVLITLARIFNIDLDAGMLTEVVSALGVLVSVAVVWYQRTTLIKAANGIGDVTNLGMRKS